MNLNDLLRSKNIDPESVLVLRHAPRKLPKLKKALPWLAANKPDVFNAYQQSQNKRVEERMKRAKYVAAFIGHEPKKALFVGLYSVQGFPPITLSEYRKIPANVELTDVYGMEEESRSSILWFDLVLTDFYAHRKGKLIVSWPPPDRAWHRMAHEPQNEMPVLSDESALETTMPAGELEQAVIESLEKKPGKGQGFLLNEELRLRLEQFAMEAAKHYFDSLGFTCEDHSKNQHYDLRCTRRDEVLYVEVKGTKTDGEKVILTAGEVEFARSHKRQMGLFIFHSIQVSEAWGEFVLAGGDRRLVHPWDVDQGCLKAVSFMYEVPRAIEKYRSFDEVLEQQK